MSATRLTSFKIHGRASFGAVIDTGIIDLGGRLGGRHPSLLALIRAGEAGLKDARAALTAWADYQLFEGEFLPPVLAPEKIICLSTNYPERTAQTQDCRESANTPNS